MIAFKNNVYVGNFYTNSKALIHLDGALRVSFDGESFSNNGDNTLEAVSKFGTDVLTEPISAIDIATVLSSRASYQSSTLGKSLIFLSRSIQIDLKNVIFDNNWMLETDYGERA